MSRQTKWTEFNNQMGKLVDWRVVATEMLGLELIGNPVSEANGWVKCRSVDGADENPSAGFNVYTGYYKDFRDGQPACSAYDLMVQIELANTFMEAKKILAKKFGVKWPTTDPTDPEHGVTWQPWNDNLAKSYCHAKPPVTIDGLKRAGARMCMRFKDPCFALPVMGASGSVEPVGWMFFPRNGQPFQHEAAKGAKSICKVQDGEAASFVCSPDHWEIINDKQGLPVFWTEGAPDMLAGLSMYPDHIFVTNAHGCAERLNERQKDAMHLGEHRLTIIGDADVPGIRGALQKQRDFGVCLARVQVLVPPYEVEDKHGKDYRDYCNEQGAQNQPCEGLAPPPAEFVNESQEVVDKVVEKDMEDEMAKRERMEFSAAMTLLGRVGIQITGADPSGNISVFCPATNGSMEINSISFTKYHQWLQFAGARFKAVIALNSKEWEARVAAGEKDCKTFSDFMSALSIASTHSALREYEKVGAGIWPVLDVDGDPTGEVMIVQHGKVYKYGNDATFTKMQSPVCGRCIAQIGTRHTWFDVDELASYIHEAQDPEWRAAVYNELFTLFDQWRWVNPQMAQLAIGLMMSTAMQTIHSWRPMVALTGESNSGKTVFMSAVNKLYGGLASFSARSTAAGVLQSLGFDSRPLLLDEFDSGSEQRKLMRIFRAASRGQDTLMGTCDHSGKTYRIVQIPWLSGIHASSRDQADLNRMINLKILSAEKNAKTLDIPDSKTLKILGLKMIAGVIVTSRAAVELAWQLSKTSGDDISSRYRESYAIPYGNLGAFLGIDVDGINDVMTDYLKNYVTPEVNSADTKSDQESMLLDILQAEVKMGNNAPDEVASIAEILFDSRYESFRDCARTKGVGYVMCKYHYNRAKVCFVGRRLTSRQGLLGTTDWSDIPNVLQILERLPKCLSPKKEKQQVAGAIITVVSVDYDALKNWTKGNMQNLKKAVQTEMPAEAPGSPVDASEE